MYYIKFSMQIFKIAETRDHTDIDMKNDEDVIMIRKSETKFEPLNKEMVSSMSQLSKKRLIDEAELVLSKEPAYVKMLDLWNYDQDKQELHFNDAKCKSVGESCAQLYNT